ncbi:MAG: single-stranded DNA-binding protein [Candidatus Nanopelagicaceae bacterium]
MNSVNLVGRIGQEPEVKYFQSGSVVCEFSLAVSSWNGQEKVTNWIPCKVWGKTAQAVADFARKGEMLGISGEIRQETWTDKTTGEKKSKLVVVAANVDFLSPKPKTEQAQQADEDNGF